MWRKLLKLRDVAYGFFKIEVNDGESTYFWFDNWLDKGRLIDVTGAAGTAYIGLPRRATVIDAMKQNEWAIRGQRSRHYHDLYAAIVEEPVPAPHRGRDVVLWRNGDDAIVIRSQPLRLGNKSDQGRQWWTGVKLYGSHKVCLGTLSSLGLQSRIDCQRETRCVHGG